MYSVVEILGVQTPVRPGDKLIVPLMAAEKGARITLDRVLLVNDGKEIKVGNPVVPGATVIAQILEHGRHPKITIFKKKRRKRYQRKVGHRQPFTRIEILEVNGVKAPQRKPAKKAVKPEKPEAVEPPQAEKTAKKAASKS